MKTDDDLYDTVTIAINHGFCGYGEETGNFSIPTPAFYDRLTRIIKYARLEGEALAYQRSMDECGKLVHRLDGSVGARYCVEIREEIKELHFRSLQKLLDMELDSQPFRAK